MEKFIFDDAAMVGLFIIISALINSLFFLILELQEKYEKN